MNKPTLQKLNSLKFAVFVFGSLVCLWSWIKIPHPTANKNIDLENSVEHLTTRVNTFVTYFINSQLFLSFWNVSTWLK